MSGMMDTCIVGVCGSKGTREVNIGIIFQYHRGIDGYCR